MEESTTQEDVQLPSVSFSTYLQDLVTTAHLYLEGFRDPETENVIVNFELAKRVIDTIEMLEEKTKGNLTAPETNFLTNSLYELRMTYIRAVNRQQETSQEDVPSDDSQTDNATPDNTPTEGQEDTTEQDTTSTESETSDQGTNSEEDSST